MFLKLINNEGQMFHNINPSKILKLIFYLFMKTLKNDLINFYSQLNDVTSKDSQKLSTALSYYNYDPGNTQYQKAIYAWNKKEFKNQWLLFKFFCEKYAIDFSILSHLKLHNVPFKATINFLNHPDGYKTIRYVVGYAVCWLKESGKEVTDETLEVLTINAIYQYCHIGKFLADYPIDKTQLENNSYFWTSDKIKNIIDEIKSRNIEKDFDDIIQVGNNYGKTIGFELPEMTEEWLREVIGDEKSYSKAVKMIQQRNPVTDRVIHWALKKTGIDKELIKRNYKKRQVKTTEEETVKEPVKETNEELTLDQELELFKSYNKTSK